MADFVMRYIGKERLNVCMCLQKSRLKLYNKIFEIIVTSTINSSEASQGHILNVILSQWVTVTHYCDTLLRNVCRNYVGNIISRFYSNSEANASELL